MTEYKPPKITELLSSVQRFKTTFEEMSIYLDGVDGTVTPQMLGDTTTHVLRLLEDLQVVYRDTADLTRNYVRASVSELGLEMGIESVPGARSPYPLTPRQFETARWVAKGHTNKEIARTMHVTEDTVKKYVQALIEKVGGPGGRRQTVAAWYGHHHGLD